MKSKKLLSLVLVVAMALSGLLIAPAKVSLAKSTSYTVVKGEKFEFSFLGAIKSVKSSKKSVVKVKKSGSNKIKITAKKAGKSTVTVKGKSGGKVVYKFKVQKNNFSPKVKQLYNANNYCYFNFEFTNKTSVYFSSATVTYGVYDVTGTEINTGTAYVYGLVPKKKAYASGKYYNSAGLSIRDVVIKKIEYSRPNMFGALKYKYSNCASKISCKKASGTSLAYTLKNKTSKTALVVLDVMYLDATGAVIGQDSFSRSLSAKQSTTVTCYPPSNYVKVKKVLRAVSETYKG